MFKKYLNVNLATIPLHLFLCFALFIGTYMTVEVESDIPAVLAYVVPQALFIGYIPNIILLIKNRNQEGNVKAFFTFSFILIIPYFISPLLVKFFAF